MFGQAAGDPGGERLERHGHVARAAAREDLGRLALRRVAEDEAPGPERQLGGKARDVLPVDRRQHLEAVVLAVAREGRDADHRRGLAAADLRAAGAGHQAVVAGQRRGLQQHIAGGHHAGAAAAGERHRNRGFRVHGAIWRASEWSNLELDQTGTLSPGVFIRLIRYRRYRFNGKGSQYGHGRREIPQGPRPAGAGRLRGALREARGAHARRQGGARPVQRLDLARQPGAVQLLHHRHGERR